MATAEATWSGGGGDLEFAETTGLVKLGIVGGGQEVLRIFVECKRCLSPWFDVERALEKERSALDRIPTADKRAVYAQLLEYALGQYEGDGWCPRMGPPLEESPLGPCAESGARISCANATAEEEVRCRSP